jgi:multidrug efflux system membrane fusion protein
VPAQSVQQGPNGAYLYVIHADNTVEMRDITLSQSDGTIAVVATGLQAGERIVLGGQYGLSPTSKVAVTTASAPSPAS